MFLRDDRTGGHPTACALQTPSDGTPYVQITEAFMINVMHDRVVKNKKKHFAGNEWKTLLILFLIKKIVSAALQASWGVPVRALPPHVARLSYSPRCSCCSSITPSLLHCMMGV